MPTYDFVCPNCGNEEEHILYMSEIGDKEKHPDCEKCGTRLDNIISPPQGVVTEDTRTLGTWMEKNAKSRPDWWFEEQSRNAKKDK